VNTSAEDTEEVPPGVVTTTFTCPGACAGETTFSTVGDVNVTGWARAVPKLTVAVEVKPLPVTVTLVPPVLGPVAGEMAVTDGATAVLVPVV
jgi:hypothetical protein